MENTAENPAPPTPETPSDLIDIETFAKVKFRVAKVEAVEAVPKSKKLFKISLDVGELGKRQIVSGIAQHYTPETLVGRSIVIVANLKPAMLMGVESNGMLLAASTDDNSILAVLQPDKEIPAGSMVR